MIEYFRRLFAHAEWADVRTLRSMVDSVSLPPHAVELFAHVLGAEHTWLSRLRGTAPRTAVWSNLTLAECDALMHENHAAYSALLAELDDGRLDQPVTYRNSAGQEFASTRSDILTQVAMHGSYHRGQIAALIRAAGDTPQSTDFIGFARGVPSPPRPA